MSLRGHLNNILSHIEDVFKKSIFNVFFLYMTTRDLHRFSGDIIKSTYLGRIFYARRIFQELKTWFLFTKKFFPYSIDFFSKWFTLRRKKIKWCRDSDRELFISELEMSTFDDFFRPPTQKTPPLCRHIGELY